MAAPNPTSAPAASDKSQSYIPIAGIARDGWSKEDEATATCFCGAVQLEFVSAEPDSTHLFDETHRGALFPLWLHPKLIHVF